MYETRESGTLQEQERNRTKYLVHIHTYIRTYIHTKYTVTQQKYTNASVCETINMLRIRYSLRTIHKSKKYKLVNHQQLQKCKTYKAMNTSNTPSFTINVCNYRQFATAKPTSNKNSNGIGGKKKATPNSNK